MRILTMNPVPSGVGASLVVDGVAVSWTAWMPSERHSDAWIVPEALGRLGQPDAVGIRFACDGRPGPARIDEALLDSLEPLTATAPPQLAESLAIARELLRLAPGLPVVASFDSAVHPRQELELARGVESALSNAVAT